MPTTKGSAADEPVRNAVQLCGRLSRSPEERTLPSGDVLLVFRVVVPRTPGVGGKARVDAIDCVAGRAGIRRSISTWSAGDLVEVAGQLHRRFWRGPAGPASRYEVEVTTGRRVSRAA